MAKLNEKELDERIKKSYRKVTDNIFLLREAFKKSGFTADEAFELVSAYVRQSAFENVLREERRKVERSALRRRFVEKPKSDDIYENQGEG